MDVPRHGVARAKRIRRTILLVLVAVALGGATYGLSRMEPAAPTVDRGVLWTGTVKRGPMLREVRGLGTLVPEETRVVPASRDGLVEQILVRVGDTVQPDTILVVLSNPDLHQTVLDAELQLRAAEAELINTRAQIESRLLDQQTSLAVTESGAQIARLQADADRQLFEDGLIDELRARRSAVDAENRASQTELERNRIEINVRSSEAQIASQEARLEQLRASYEVRKNQIEQLNVRAGASGVLQRLDVEIGQRIGMGSVLARVAEPGRLKAVLRIPETQMKDIAIGQAASIDTRSGIVPGRVVRIDPSAVQGTVTVDVQLEGELPRGARPDLSVDGTVEIERLAEVVYVDRPAYGQADSTIQLFKIMPNDEAVRVPVRLGRVSVNVVEVVEGLGVGEEVILSDMSAWDAVDRVRLR